CDVADDFLCILGNQRKRQRASLSKRIDDVLFRAGGVRGPCERGARQREYLRYVGLSLWANPHQASRAMRTSVETTVRSESNSSGMTNSNSWRCTRSMSPCLSGCSAVTRWL